MLILLMIILVTVFAPLLIKLALITALAIFGVFCWASQLVFAPIFWLCGHKIK